VRVILSERVSRRSQLQLEAELAESLSFGVGFALMLCGDSVSACENDARIKAEADLKDEIKERASAIWDTHPEMTWQQAREIVIKNMLKERGLDEASLQKAEAERREFQEQWRKQEFLIQHGWQPLVRDPRDNAPRMSPR
jgi:hypothetical protein